jgi:hypothetical protein
MVSVLLNSTRFVANSYYAAVTRYISCWKPTVVPAAEFIEELSASLELGHEDAPVPFFTPKSKIDVIKI